MFFTESYSCAVSLFYVHTTTWPRLRRISRVDRSERFEHVSEYVLLMGKVDYHDSFIVTKRVTHVASCILRWRVVCMKDYPDNRKDCDESLSGALCCRTALFAITIWLVICTQFKAKYMIILPQGEVQPLTSPAIEKLESIVLEVARYTAISALYCR